MSEVVGLTCGACGADSSPGARFCASCGQPLVTMADERRILALRVRRTEDAAEPRHA